MKIGYLGPQGTFSQMAADKYAQSLSNFNKEIEVIPFSKIPDILKAVDNGEIDEGVVPFEILQEHVGEVIGDGLGVDHDAGLPVVVERCRGPIH